MKGLKKVFKIGGIVLLALIVLGLLAPEDKGSETVAPTSAPKAVETEASPEPTPEPETETPADGIRPEIKEAIDAYEQFFRDYCDFIDHYDSADTVQAMKYLTMMASYTENMDKLEALESDLNAAETVYYEQAMLRIDAMLLHTAQKQ